MIPGQEENEILFLFTYNLSHTDRSGQNLVSSRPLIFPVQLLATFPSSTQPINASIIPCIKMTAQKWIQLCSAPISRVCSFVSIYRIHTQANQESSWPLFSWIISRTEHHSSTTLVDLLQCPDLSWRCFILLQRWYHLAWPQKYLLSNLFIRLTKKV